MKCTEIRERLSEYIDGFMDAETEARVREHLSSCKTCSGELESLKALVKELGDLDPVEAPSDFLARLHEKMERPFGLSKILHALFRPFKIKLPLEFAGAAAAAVLVFIVLNVQQPKEELPYRALPEKQEEITRDIAPAAQAPHQPERTKRAKIERSPAPAVPETPAMLEAPRSLLAVENIEEDKAKGKPAPIELALIVRLDRHRQRPAAPSAPSDAFDLQATERQSKEDARAAERVRPKTPAVESYALDEEREGAEPLGASNGSRKDRVSASSQTLKRVLSRVQELITLHHGRVVSVAHKKSTRVPPSILADIPADRLRIFSNDLKTLGYLKTPPTISSEDTAEMIRVRIRFLPPG